MIYMFLANGFEEVEALAPLDMLRRAEIEIKTVGIGAKTVVGAHNIPIVADITDSEFSDYESIDMIILPGGMPGTLNLDQSDTVHKAIRAAINSNAYIGAICAAPMILGKMGLLNGKKAVCYPGFEEYLKGAEISDQKVVSDGKIITAKGMGAAVEFGLLLVEAIKDKATAKKLRRSTISE